MRENIGKIVPVILFGCGALAGLAMPMNATAEIPLQPHLAEYKVKISILGGQLKTELRATGDGYIATHVVRPTGMSKMIARGRISDTSEFANAVDGVRPTRFRSDDNLSRDKGRTSISFDWDTGEARGTVNGETVVSFMDDLAHDRISIQYELMHDLLNGGASAQYILFDVDRLKRVNVRTVGRREVKVPAGRYTAIGIQHQADNSKRITTLWCVEELGYLPVIIEQHRRGKLKFRATLKTYSPLGG